MSHSCTDTQAVCRGCGRNLQGSPYFKGGQAYVPAANPRHEYDRTPAKRNYYGGWVCSRRCDHRSSLELEQSMPGHGWSQQRLGSAAAQSLAANWDNDT